MMYFATMMTDEADAGERAKAISAAKAQIGRSAKFIGQQATQLHGGIAMTYEYKLGHLFKRLTMIDLAYGDADCHLTAAGRPDELVRLTGHQGRASLSWRLDSHQGVAMRRLLICGPLIRG